MIRNLIGGIAIGIANVIPGVSGGTMMVILGIFEEMMFSVSNVLKKDNPNRMKQLLFLIQVLIGALIGLIGFAKILNVLFAYYPTQTMFWFIGLVVFSIPVFLKSEMRDSKISYGYLIFGIVVIFVFQLVAPTKDGIAVNPELPSISLKHLLLMFASGVAGGFAMLLPGLSGSMVLLILGQYYLFKSYLASVTTFSLDVLIPLSIMGIGILFGILLSAILTNKALKMYKEETLSFILGLIIASSIALIPLNTTYTFTVIISSMIAFFIGGGMIMILKKFS